MPELLVGTVDEFEDGVRILISTPKGEIGVFRIGDRWFAFLNSCRHEGGPICEGIVIGKVSAVLDDLKQELGRRFSAGELHLACPWHGWEYDISTGEFAGDPRLKLHAFPVKLDGDRVFVIA